MAMAVDRLFTVLDRDGTGTVKWRWAMVIMMSLCRGTAQDKATQPAADLAWSLIVSSFHRYGSCCKALMSEGMVH